MKKLFLLLLLAFVCGATQRVPAQTTTPTSLNHADLPQVEIDRIIKAFSAREAEYRKALNLYGFKRDAKFQTIGFGGQVTGEYHRISTFSFNDQGERFEKIIQFPQPTLTEVSMTAEDIDDLNGVNPFALEGGKIDRYDIKYAGQERIDDLDLYVFDVQPKNLASLKKVSERYFMGRIWVDKTDLQIVKSKGKGVPEDKRNKFLPVETYREQIDGKYWFPTYTYGNDQLVFDSGQTVRLRILVTYTNFKRFGGKVRIIEDAEDGPGVEDKSETPPATPAPTPTPTPRKP